MRKSVCASNEQETNEYEMRDLAHLKDLVLSFSHNGVKRWVESPERRCWACLTHRTYLSNYLPLFVLDFLCCAAKYGQPS